MADHGAMTEGDRVRIVSYPEGDEWLADEGVEIGAEGVVREVVEGGFMVFVGGMSWRFTSDNLEVI